MALYAEDGFVYISQLDCATLEDEDSSSFIYANNELIRLVS